MALRSFLEQNAPLDTQQKLDQLLEICKTEDINMNDVLEDTILSKTSWELYGPVVKLIDELKKRTRQKPQSFLKVKDSKKSASAEYQDKLRKLINGGNGKHVSYNFVCDKCKNTHRSGYLFTDGEGNEYVICAYCCKKKHDHIGKIIYTPMGNKR